MNRVTIALLAALPLAALLGCGHGAAKPKRGTVERLPRLEVVQPKRTRLERKLDLAATVEALLRDDLKARVPGRVTQLKVDIGDAVKAGEVLLVLEVPELAAEEKTKKELVAEAKKRLELAAQALAVAKREVEEAKKEEKRAKADVDFQKVRYGNIKELVRRGSQQKIVEEEALRSLEVAKATHEAAGAKVLVREAKVLSAQADQALAKQRIEVAQAELDKASALVREATIRAPFTGVITKRWVDPGAVIKDPGERLLTVMHLDKVRVLIDVPQRDVPLLNTTEQSPNPNGKGDPVELHIAGLGLPAGAVRSGEKTVGAGGTFHGTVTRMATALDPVTRTMRAEMILNNRAGYLRPGMYGKASVQIEDREGVLTVPATALARRGAGKVEVYYVAETTGEGQERRGVLRRKEVILGIDDGKIVEVRGGLKGDELIVARGNGVMRVDEKVIAVLESAVDP